MRYVCYYILFMNMLGILVMGIDKLLAKQEFSIRVPEKVLFGISLLGGSLGTLVGMYGFRHKTQHWYFVWGMPASLLLHIGMFLGYMIFIN